MSWAEYLTNLQRDGLAHAAICGTDAASWNLSTEGSNITQVELAELLTSMASVDTLASSGVRLGGIKYMYISGTDSVVRGKKGDTGVHCAKSMTTLIVGVYDGKLQPGQAANVVERLADYLKQNNM